MADKTDRELDAARDRMVAALYGELPPEEEEELLTRLAGDAALREEWDELQGARTFLRRADADEVAPDFQFEPPTPIASTKRGRSWWGRVWSGTLVRPALGFPLAAAACVVLLLAGLRVDRVQGGLVFHFQRAGAPLTAGGGPDTNEGLRLAPVSQPRVEVHYANGQPVDPEAERRLAAPVTRAELAAFAQEMLGVIDKRLEEQENRTLGRTTYLLRGYFNALEERDTRNREELNSNINEALMRLVGADRLDDDRLLPPRQSEQENPDSPPQQLEPQQEEDAHDD